MPELLIALRTDEVISPAHPDALLLGHDGCRQ